MFKNPLHLGFSSRLSRHQHDWTITHPELTHTLWRPGGALKLWSRLNCGLFVGARRRMSADAPTGGSSGSRGPADPPDVDVGTASGSEALTRAQTFGIKCGLGGAPDGGKLVRYQAFEEFHEQCDFPISYLTFVEAGSDRYLTDHTQIELGKDYDCIRRVPEPVIVDGMQRFAWNCGGTGTRTCIICGEVEGRDFSGFPGACLLCGRLDFCRRCAVCFGQIPFTVSYTHLTLPTIYSV